MQWEALWQALLSPRALEALLYIGAFLIIVAAGTFVYFNWGRFSPALQLLFLAAGTASFFAGGWLVQTRWRLTQSGAVLVGIGTLIIPVDFYGWARFREVPADAYPGIWLTASAFCLVVYGLTTWWIRHRFFAVITLLAGHSLLLASLRSLNVPLQWWAAPTILLAAVWLSAAPAADRLGPGLTQAVLVTAVTAVAVALTVPAVYSFDQWIRWLTTAVPAGGWSVPFAAAWWAAAGYFLAGLRRNPTPNWAYAVLVSIPVALIFTLGTLVPPPWVSLTLLALAPLYVWAGKRGVADISRPAHAVGMVLPLAALLWTWMDVRAVPPAYLGGAVLYLAGGMYLRRPGFAFGAHGLAVIGLVTLAYVLRLPQAYWALAVLIPSLPALVLASSTRPPMESLAESLYLGAFAEMIAAVLAPPLFASMPVRAAAVAVAFGTAVFAAARTHRQTDPALQAVIPGAPAAFHWAAAVLAIAELTLLWLWRRPVPHGLPAAAVVLASLFILVGRRLKRVDQDLALPWTTTALALSAAGPVLALALNDRLELTVTLILVAATYAVWAWLLHEPALAHLAAWVFLVPFGRLLQDGLVRGLLPSAEAFAWLYAGLAAAYLVLGTVLDRRSPRFAVPWHAVSHILIPFALIWALPQEDVTRWTLAVAIAFYVSGAALARRDRSHTLRRAALWMARAMPAGEAAFRSSFVYVAAVLFPFWFYLTLQSTGLLPEGRAVSGVAIGVLAWVYLGTGQLLRRVDGAYVTPMRIGAQALAVVGGLLATDVRQMLIVTMSLGVALQLAFLSLTGAVTWIYTSAIGAAGLLGLVLRHVHVSSAQAGWAMLILSSLYLAIAERPWRLARTETMPPASAALYAVAFLVAAVGLLLDSFQGPGYAAAGYAVGAAVFAWAGWRLREALFSYAVAGLLAAAYTSALVGVGPRAGVAAPTYGLWLLPGIAAFFALGWMLDRSDRPRAIAGSWGFPFMIAAHIGTVVMMAYSAQDALRFPLALGTGTAVYGVSALRFRSARWLYPALVSLHLAIFFGLLRWGMDPRWVPGAFVLVAFAVAFAGHWIERVGGEVGWGTTWARPCYVLALTDMLLWEIVGVIDVRTHTVTSLGFALLAGIFAQVRRDERMATFSLGLSAIGLFEVLRWLNVPFPSRLLALSLASLILGAGDIIARYTGRARLWRFGAERLAFGLSAATLTAAVLGVSATVHPEAGRGLVYTLGIVGLLYLLYSVRGRIAWLGYAAVGMLEAAWAIFLLKGLQVNEIQWYAIPASLYLLGIGAIERRIGRHGFAQIVDYAGLTLLFGSALMQSLGTDGFWYAVLVSIEGLLVAWFGLVQRVRRHFFAGLGILVANVIIQAVDPLRAFDKTILFLILGLVLVGTAVFAERKREQIMRTTRAWRERLETWQ